MTEYPEYNPLDDSELLPIEPTQELTLTESFESGHEHLFYQTLSERKLSLTEVANALIENDNGWGLILAKIIEKL